MEDAMLEVLRRFGAPEGALRAWRGQTVGTVDMVRLQAAMTVILRSFHPFAIGPREIPSPAPHRSGTMRTMCGRARLSIDFSQIRIQLKLSPDTPSLNLRPTWNIAPTQDMLIVADRPGVGRAARLAKWGLIPSWSKEPKAMGATFNAKVETMREKPTFRNAWSKGRRCLIVVDGFYEWERDSKWPVAIARADGRPMTFGGLWERWAQEGQEEIYSCTVITQDAGPAMRSIHDREPLIIEERDWPVWLGEEPGDVDALLKPCAADALVYWKVPKEVGNVRNNGPELIEKVGR